MATPANSRRPDNGSELVLGAAKGLAAVALFPAVVVGKLAAATRVPWYYLALASALAAAYSARRYGVTWATTEFGPALKVVTLEYVGGWGGLVALAVAWWRQAMGAAGLVPAGRLGEAWGRLGARLTVVEGVPAAEPWVVLAATAALMAPVALTGGLALAALWEFRRPRKVWDEDVDEGDRIKAARWRVPLWTTIRARKPGGHPKAGVLLGFTQGGRAFTLPWKELRRHVLIVGTTGSGKSVAMGRVYDAAVQAGHGLVVVDFKGDPAIKEAFERYPGALVWGFDGGLMLDVLKGDPTEVADKLTAAESWSEKSTFYRPICWGYSQMVAKLLKLRDGPDASINPWEVWKLLDPAAFQQECRQVCGDDPETMGRLMPDLSPEDREEGLAGYDQADAQRALTGFRLKLQGMLHSAAGARFGPAADGRESLDLTQAVRDGRPVLFSINANRYQEVSRRAAAWVFLEVRRVVGVMQAKRWGERGNQGLLAIDELNAIGQEAAGLVPLFETARGAGFGLLIGTTGLNAILRLPEHGGDAVDQNTPTKIVMQQEGREDRKAWVEAFGWRNATERPRRVNDDGSVTAAGTLRSVRRPVVAGEELAALVTGQAVVKRGGRVSRVVVAYPRPLLPGWLHRAGRWLSGRAVAALGRVLSGLHKAYGHAIARSRKPKRAPAPLVGGK